MHPPIYYEDIARDLEQRTSQAIHRRRLMNHVKEARAEARLEKVDRPRTSLRRRLIAVAAFLAISFMVATPAASAGHAAAEPKAHSGIAETSGLAADDIHEGPALVASVDASRT